MATAWLRGIGSRFLQDALGYGIGGAITPVIEPLTQDLANETWSQHPSRPIDPGTASTGQIRAPDAGIDWGMEARLGGISPERFAAIVAANRTVPDAMTIVELLRRDVIDRATAERGLEQAGLKPSWIGQALDLLRTHLSPAEAAAARQQGFISVDRQKEIAKRSGVTADDAEIQFQLAGMPPGVELALTLLRRNVIDEATFRQIVAEGNTKTKYTDALLTLVDGPISAEQAATAVLKGVIPEEEGRRYAKMDGAGDREFEILIRNVGNPPSLTQSLQLWRRGVITEEDFARNIALGRTRTEFTQDLSALKVAIPSIVQIKLLVQSGALADDKAIQYLQWGGYEPDVAQGIVAAAHKDKTAKSRDLTQSMVEDLYDAGLETKEWALTQLAALGYDPDESESILLLTDARRYFAALQAAISRTKNKFVAHQISQLQAIGQLDQLSIGADARNRLIEIWSVERDSNVSRLTQSQVIQAMKKGLIDANNALSRLQEMGYPSEDAAILVAIGGGTPS